MRCIFTGIARDGNGNIVPSSTVTPFLYGTATAVSIYTTLTGTTAVNSVTAGDDGSFTFYVDRFDYNRDQCFDIQISKTGWTTWKWTNVDIKDVVLGTYAIAADKTVSTNLGLIPEGVIYAPASGKTLTISGKFTAGDYQIFSGDGSVVGLRTCNPYWFGLLADGTDETTTVQTALKATVAGGLLTIPNGTRWDYDTIKSDHPDDVLIIDYSGYDWQYNLANSAQVRYITNTSSPSSKNSHNYVFMADYHPAVVVDNLTEHVAGQITPQMSYVIRENGKLRWQLSNSYFNDRPLFAIVGRYYYPEWVTGKAYSISSTVLYGGTSYHATVAHTSGDWATDLAAGKWANASFSTEAAFEILGIKGMPITLGGVPNPDVKLKVEDTLDREMSVYFRAYTGNDLRIRLQSGTSTRWSVLSEEATGILSLISAVLPRATYTFSPDGKIGASDGFVSWNTSYVAEGTYDFSVNGGAIGTIDLTEAGVPYKATVKRAWYEVLTPPTSSGAATIALGVSNNDTDGIKTATAYNDASFNAGYHDGTPDGTAANFTTKTTGHRYLCIKIAGAALTAGKIKVYAEFMISE